MTSETIKRVDATDVNVYRNLPTTVKQRRSKRAQRPGRAVTIRDVAARAGVSTATVSRVLTGLGPAGGESRTRVLQATRALDYHPNRLARGLRARQRQVIGVIIPDLQNPFFTGVVHGVEAVLCREGYTLLLGHSDGEPERERKHLGVLRGEAAAGLVFIPGNADGARYDVLQAWAMKVVAVDRAPSGLDVDLVGTNNREAARAAIAHLVKLGHRGIALINGPEGFDVTRERLAGYRAALAAAGIRGRDDFVVSADFRQPGGQRAMDDLLELPQPPQAVLIANNLMTLGALQAIHERGLRIPEEVAVIGFDDIPWAASLRPSLTAVAQPAEELGRAAAQLLLERLREPQRPTRHVILPSRLVIRASCGAHLAPPGLARRHDLKPSASVSPTSHPKPAIKSL